VAALLPRVAQGRRWAVPSWLPRPLTPLLAAVVGVASPLPTLGMVPLVLRLQADGLPAAAALTFILASSLMNPQLFVLTLGALGAGFALAQLGSVLLLSTGLGLALGGRLRARRRNGALARSERQESSWAQLAGLAGHVGLYFLVGVIAGASLQVLLPQLGVLGWMGERGWLSTPALGWLGTPLYTCGGSAVPLASSLAQIGFSPGTMFAFLLVGPAMRGTTLAALGCLLPRRAQAACLAALTLAAGLLGYGFDWLVGVV
jgi:uncharacterized membrane protein YraQ (UPF0718 family)